MDEEIEVDLNTEIDETIRNTLKEIQSRAPETPEAPETTPETPTPEKTVDKPRDETGKFVKAKEPAAERTASPQSPEQTAPATQAAEPQEPAPVLTTGAPIDLTRAPSSWKPAAKAVWAGLPEPVRAEIYRRESDFLNGNKGLRENADFGQSVKQVVEPYRMLIEAEGGTPERAIADTLRTAALFRVGTPQQKLAAIFDIDKQFNAGLTQYVQQEFNRLYAQQTGQPQVQQPAQYQDPRVDQMQQALQAMENERKKQDQERSSREQQASNAAVERFMSAKDDKGQPLYVFIDNVLDDMSARVQMLRRTNPAVSHEDALKQAYEAAVWANPETRAVLISQQQAQLQQPAETLRKVEQAKRASAVNVPKRGALPATEPPKSLDETIRETGKALGMF